MFEDYVLSILNEERYMEKLSEEGNVFRGLLITPGTWKGYTYTEDELKKAIPTLIGKFITLDHDDRFNSHVGVIKNAFWDDELGGVVIDFEVIDPVILEKLNKLAEQGLLHEVGLSAELVYSTISNSDKTVKGISFKKATLTFHPAVKDARVIAKLSEDRYLAQIIETKEDGSLIVSLRPVNLESDYPPPEEAPVYPYPNPGYPIPPDEWKQLKEMVANLEKRVSELEKKVLKNTDVSLSEGEVSKPQTTIATPTAQQVDNVPSSVPGTTSITPQSTTSSTTASNVQHPSSEPAQSTQPNQEPNQPITTTKPESKETETIPLVLPKGIDQPFVIIPQEKGHIILPLAVYQELRGENKKEERVEEKSQEPVNLAPTKTEPLTIQSEGTPQPNDEKKENEDPVLEALNKVNSWSELDPELKKELVKKLLGWE